MNWGDILQQSPWQEFFTSKVQESEKNTVIWIICTQEDTRESLFMNALRTQVLKEEYYNYHTKTPKKVYLGKFHVHLSVFVPKSLNYPMNHLKSLYHPSYNIPDKPIQNYMKNSIYHKSSVVINIGGIMRVVGSHLPFNPSDESNSSMRQAALREIISIANSGNIPTFILGDLNFRYINNSDQLTEFINSFNLNGFTITDITNNIPFTCKTIKTNDKNCDKVFKSSQIKSTSNNSKNVTCYNQARNKSKCDRILAVLPRSYKVCNDKAEPLVFYPINMSDHNAVFASCTLTNKNIGDEQTCKEGGSNGKKKVYVLGRARIVTKVGRKYMVTYKRVKISLGEARRIEKENKN